jgi:diguanylate cyclase (GGDEF)-like protein
LIRLLARPRAIVISAALLFVTHIGVVATLGTAVPGPLLSDLIQLILGSLVVFACVGASRSSEGMARSVWGLTAAAYVVWFFAQSLGVYMDLSRSADSAQWISNLLFCFWFAPLAIALFLGAESETASLDAVVILDFVQAVLVCVAAYLYFFYLPKSDAGGGLAHSVWAPYFVGYGFVACAFLLRAAVTHSSAARSLFGKLGGFLALSGMVDAMYYYGPGRSLKTGAWFDILWSLLLIAPLVMAATWRQPEPLDLSNEAAKREKKIHTEIFYLFYPVLVLFMSLHIARERLGLAAAVVFLSFMSSSARLLVTQYRLVQAQEALRREASRDGLTSLWNRKASLEIFERELLRSQRRGGSVGVIMADVDHFKAVNDSRGHVAGDLVLRIIASEIAAVVRPYDSVGRYGGEEFLIVVPGCSASETWELAERIRSCVANCSVVAGGSCVNVSLSLGIAAGNSAADVEKLLQQADTALYQAKNAGRNRVEPAAGHAVSVSQDSAPAQSKFWL